MSLRASVAILLFTAMSFVANATKYYVAPDGDNSNPGTIEQPFLTIQRAQTSVVAGDTVYIRGGTYTMTSDQIAKTDATWAYVSYLDKSGSSGKRINYWAYPGEKPIFDFQNIKPSLRVNAFQVNGSYIHLKGFEVIGVQVTLTTNTQSECFENQGSNNIYEQLSMHDNQAIGFYLIRGSNNVVLNCDAYKNWDYTSENKLGGDVDGFGNHPLSAAHTNNIFRGCRAWFNSDDGYDCISAHTPTTFENCWAFYNGYSSSFGSLADGNGFKAGGYGTTAFDRLPVTIPRNVIKFCLAVRNKSNGFYSNHHLEGSDWYNNSGYYNSVNFNMLNRKAKNTTDYLTDVSGYNHVMRNNLGFGARSTELSNLDQSASDASGNYFNLPVTVTTADFMSLDMALLTQARQADGSLPDIGLMKLVSGSDLIDAGTNAGFSYFGSKPDLGYREFGFNYLPIKLISFSAQKTGLSIALNWQTSTEVNNNRFEIERAKGNNNFEKIGTVQASGTSAVLNNYMFNDFEQPGSIVYYRLKQVDLDGSFSYSPIVSVQSEQSFAAYPNPVAQTLNFAIPSENSSMKLDLSIRNIAGQKVKGAELISSDLLNYNVGDLAPGIYFIEVRNAATAQLIGKSKIVKE